MAQPEPSQLPESFKVAEAQLLCAMKQGAILLQRLIHINDPVQKTLQRRRERIGMSENWVTVFRDPKKICVSSSLHSILVEGNIYKAFLLYLVVNMMVFCQISHQSIDLQDFGCRK
jgi:hypothetical protein